MVNLKTDLLIIYYVKHIYGASHPEYRFACGISAILILNFKNGMY